jgi:tetratricopeptide (TPR) repeat protein
MRWLAAVAVCLLVAGTARGDDWGARRDPFDPQIVRRYKQILATDPHDDSALRHLVELYQRYRTVAKLEAEYEKEMTADGNNWAVFVVLARLPRKSIQDTRVWWMRAVHAKPDDADGWLALGDTLASDPAGATDSYRHAAQLFHSPAKRKIALGKLASAARIAGDAATVDGAYAELIELSPKDGSLWLERGNAQLAAKQFTGALDSFTAAEPLLRTDPERQLTAVTSRGMALEGLGRPDDAIIEYVRALDHSPPGYYLRQELVARIVDVDRRRKQLWTASERLEKRWPEKSRGYFEWSTLGDLYKEMHDDERALAAYKHAVAKAPTEVTTQRKLIALLDKLRPSEALAAHEAAARIAPGDADLQLELAKRYHPDSHDKAYATLEALARRMSRNVGVLGAIAALYEQWDETKLAIKHYETIATVEPNEPDHAVVLGEAYWRADDQPRARLAWYRLDKIGTPDALFRHGEVLALHDLWNESITPYSKALALDGSKPEVWYGRARAYDSLSKFPAALEDARRAVALSGYATHADGLRYRQLLVRVLARVEKTPETDLGSTVATWRFAFDHGDAAAGYLLAAHHARLSSYQLHDVLEKLYRIVPTDDSLGIALARSYEHRREFERARTDLEEIARRSPARAQEIGKLLAELDKERERAEEQIRWEEEGRAPRTTGRPDLVGRTRVGWRFLVGADVRDAGAAVLGLGMYTSYQLAPGAALAVRLDWTQHSDVMTEADAFALGGIASMRVLDLRKVEVALGAGGRGELRYGREGSHLDRAALAGDLALEVLPRGVPAVVGLRLDQSLTDDVKATSLLVELGFEIR